MEPESSVGGESDAIGGSVEVAGSGGYSDGEVEGEGEGVGEGEGERYSSGETDSDELENAEGGIV